MLNHQGQYFHDTPMQVSQWLYLVVSFHTNIVAVNEKNYFKEHNHEYMICSVVDLDLCRLRRSRPRLDSTSHSEQQVTRGKISLSYTHLNEISPVAHRSLIISLFVCHSQILSIPYDRRVFSFFFIYCSQTLSIAHHRKYILFATVRHYVLLTITTVRYLISDIFHS